MVSVIIRIYGRAEECWARWRARPGQAKAYPTTGSACFSLPDRFGCTLYPMCATRLLLAISLSAPLFAQPARHPFQLDDVTRLRDVRDPQCSPDGLWVAYTVATTDPKEDKHDTDVWMVSYDGKHDLRLTSSPEAEGTPRWSPDGKYLAFLSDRKS